MYRLPQGHRRRAAFVKLFQVLQYVRNNKMLKDFNIEEESSLCRYFFLRALMIALMARRLL